MKACVTQYLLCLGLSWSHLFNGLLVPGASAKVKFTAHGRRCAVQREARNHWMQTPYAWTPVHGTGWEVSKAKLRRSWKHCFYSAWSRKGKGECNWCCPLPSEWLVRRWRQALPGSMLRKDNGSMLRDNKQGATRKVLITWKEKVVHYEAALTLRQAAQGIGQLRP